MENADDPASVLGFVDYVPLTKIFAARRIPMICCHTYNSFLSRPPTGYTTGRAGHTIVSLLYDSVGGTGTDLITGRRMVVTTVDVCVTFSSTASNDSMICFRERSTEFLLLSNAAL